MASSGIHITLKAAQVFSLFGVPITNTILATWLVGGALLIAAYFVGKNLTLVPGTLQAGAETLYEYLYSFVHSTLGNEKYARRYFPLVATIFLFVLTANSLEFSPLFGPIGVIRNGSFVELFHVITSDLNSTLALALITFFTVEFSGVLTLGVLKYGSKFVNFKGGVMGFAIGLLEIVSNLARLISLSFRLFGAIFAGDVLVMVINSFTPYLASVPLMAFEMFVGLLQAAIFAILTLAYLKLALDEPHGSAHAEEHSHSRLQTS